MTFSHIQCWLAGDGQCGAFVSRCCPYPVLLVYLLDLVEEQQFVTPYCLDPNGNYADLVMSVACASSFVEDRELGFDCWEG